MSEEIEDLQATTDVSAQRVAHVYALALLNAAEAQGQEEGVVNEVKALLSEVFRRAPSLEVLLSGSALGRARREEIIRQVFGGRASELFVNFLLVLNDHERLELLRPIGVALVELLNQRRGRIRVVVHSASPLVGDQQAQIGKIIRDVWHLEPILDVGVDPELIGGLRIRVGDWLYDGSVRTELETIRTVILQESSHEIQSRRDRICPATGD
jgi:F-type H+-transporting ATPase subunit delta